MPPCCPSCWSFKVTKMGSLEDLFKAVESGNYVEESLYEELHQGIKSKAYSILKIVENLGILLVNKDTLLRKKGTHILSQCLGMLEKNYLTCQELEFLVAFYCDRLKDHHSVIPEVLLGLYHVCDMKQLPHESYCKLFPVVFLQFNCQSQVINDRKIFYEILFKCMQHNIEGLKPMGPDFVYGVVQSIDGERDPRNLMFLFTSLIPLFFNHFDLYHLHEEMFDIMACYFPVDFRPKENDPDAISREDLSNALMPNLTAKASFGEFCIPLALEKLESDLKIAKLDSLVLLTSACYKFPLEKVRENTNIIWNVVKKDFNSGDPDVKQKLVTMLHAMLTVLPDEDAKHLFHNIYNHVKFSFTTNIDGSLFISNLKTLIDVSRDSKISMQEMAILLVPILYFEVNKTYNYTYLEILNEILEICTHNLSINLSELTDLSLSWNDLLSLYLKLCENSITCLQGLTILHSFLDADQRKTIYKILYDIMKSKAPSYDYETYLCTFAKHYIEEVTEQIITPFKNEIINPRQKQYPNVNNIKNEVLENLKQNDPTIYTKDEIETGFYKPLAYKRNEDSEEIPLFLAICPPAPDISIEEIFIKNVYCPLISCDIHLKGLSQDVIRFCLLEEPDESSCFRLSVKDSVSNISYLKFILYKYESKFDIVCHLENEYNICEKVINIYLESVANDEYYSSSLVLDSIAVLNIILNALYSTKKDNAYITSINTKALFLVDKVLEIKQKDICLIILIPLFNRLDFKDVQNSENLSARISGLGEMLFEMAITSKDAFINKYLSILLSIISNGIENLESNKFGMDLNLFLTKLQSLPFNNNVSTLHSYLTKSLIVRGYKNIDSWMELLIVTLRNFEKGNHAIEGLKVILKEDNLKDDYFEYKNVKFLYRQRLFTFTLKNILKNISIMNAEIETNENSISNDRKIVKLNNYQAILVQLKYLPSQIIISQIKTLLPIMIECLSLICDTQFSEKANIDKSHINNTNEINYEPPNESVTYHAIVNFDDSLENLLDLFKDFLKTKLEILQEYTNSFVDKFLTVACYHNSLSHRISALQCLYYLSYFDVIRLMPFKNKVIEGLKHCLDDRKRLVRKQAVETISRWYILDNEVE